MLGNGFHDTNWTRVWLAKIALWSIDVALGSAEDGTSVVEVRFLSLSNQLVDTKTLSNATVQQRAVQLLGAATANISAAMADLDLLRRRLEPASPLPEAQRILDLVTTIILW